MQWVNAEGPHRTAQDRTTAAAPGRPERVTVPDPDRVQIARLAAHVKWAGCEDRPAATARARAKFDERFAKMVDPDGTLDPKERATRAANARKAYFLDLARKSARSRRAKKASRASDAAAEVA
jgi:hypothetical protein